MKKKEKNSVFSQSKENVSLIKKIFKQKNELKKISEFKKNNVEKAEEIKYEVRVEDPSLKGNKLERKINQEINKYIKKEEKEAKRIAKRQKNEAIVRQQDAKKLKK